MSRPLLPLLFAIAAGPIFMALVLIHGHDPMEHAGSMPLIHRESGYAGSMLCQACHPDQHASWRQTFHRTMTQRASPESVQGNFDGRHVTYRGKVAIPWRDGDRFLIDVPDGQGSRTAEVALAVGSRRYQQYFEQVERSGGFAMVRLPILWHMETSEWLHLNEIFLAPDDSDWDRHRATWNENCIFCHNTAPQPRFTNYQDLPAQADKQFDSKVAELGISCEACHGPGAEHAARMASPARRLKQRLSSEPDPTIVHPARLDPSRSVAVCGQCHGARLPEPRSAIANWLDRGPDFRPGHDLLQHMTPLTAKTESLFADQPDLFRLRFWHDGTPRLTAYEHQGVVASPCHERGPMTCLSCHQMHGGDIHGQLEPRMRGNDACLQCHQEIGKDIAAHTHHLPHGVGSNCMDCHMPRIVYGVLSIHRSHKIEIPDIARDTEGGRPNACALCHQDRSPLWIASKMREWWGEKYRDPVRRKDGSSLDLPEAVVSLHAGDAVQRAVYAHALGRSDTAHPSGETVAQRAHLVVTLGDAYPSVRHLAARSLRALEETHAAGIGASLALYQHRLDAPARRQMVLGLLSDLARNGTSSMAPPLPGMLVDLAVQPDLNAILALLELQELRVIAIGE